MAELNKKELEFPDLNDKNTASAENNGRRKRKSAQNKKEGEAKKYKGNEPYESVNESENSLQIIEEESEDSEEESSPQPSKKWKGNGKNKYGKHTSGSGRFQGGWRGYRNYLDYSQKDPFENEKLFWKIAKPKICYTLYSCRNCSNYNFKRGQFRVKGDRLIMQLGFCSVCTRMNMDVTDTYMKNIVANIKEN